MRLIDRDALIYKLTEEIRRDSGEHKYGMELARLLVIEEPTVAKDWIIAAIAKGVIEDEDC